MTPAEELAARQLKRYIHTGIVFAVFVFILGMWGCPQYNVYERTLDGEAQLKSAEWSRQIKIKEAMATLEASKSLALSDIERAKGVAESNRIIGASLHENSEYLKWLWIEQLKESKGNVIYVPTETNLPILEASRLLKKQTKGE